MINGEIKHRKHVWFQALHISLCHFLFGYSLGMFNNCSENVAYSMSWTGSEKTLCITLFSAAIPLGALISASATSYICELIGRRRALLLTDLVVIIASGLSVVPSTIPFGFGRIFMGAGVGMCLAISPIYIAETTPKPMMPLVGPSLGIMIAFGITTSYGLGLVVPTGNYEGSLNQFWQFIMAFPAVIALYQAVVVGVWFKYDSPVYYLSNGDRARYRASLQSIFHEEDIEAEMNKPEKLRRQNSRILEVTTFRELLCNKSYRRMVRIGVLLVFIQQFSGIHAILFYSSFFFQETGMSVSLSRLITFFLGITMLISNLGTVILLKYIGRKTSLLCGQILLAIDLLVIALLSHFAPTATTAIAISTCLFLVFFSFPFQGTLYTYLGEVQNKTALSISTSLLFVGNMSVLLSFPHVVSAFGVAPSFYFFACCEAFGAIYTAIDVFETKNKSVKDIQNKLFSIEPPTGLELKSIGESTVLRNE